MPVNEFHHVNIRVADLEASREFYESVLGLRAGFRPPVGVPGHWMYCGEAPVLHLTLRDNLAEPPPATGRIDHVAFGARDFAGTKAMLEARGIAYRESKVPSAGVWQIFLTDPNNVTLELNFPAEE